jgi:hypothetical protein
MAALHNGGCRLRDHRSPRQTSHRKQRGCDATTDVTGHQVTRCLRHSTKSSNAGSSVIDYGIMGKTVVFIKVSVPVE